MIKQLLNSVIAKYRDLSVSRRSRYFVQPRPIIVKYLLFADWEVRILKNYDRKLKIIINPIFILMVLSCSRLKLITFTTFEFRSHNLPTLGKSEEWLHPGTTILGRETRFAHLRSWILAERIIRTSLLSEWYLVRSSTFMCW